MAGAEEFSTRSCSSEAKYDSDDGGEDETHVRSAAFVALSDAFTAEFLRVFYSGRGHPSRNDISVLARSIAPS